MNEQLSKYLNPIKTFWEKQSKKNRIIILSIIGAIVLISVVFGVILNSTPYKILYSGLNRSDSEKIIETLATQDIDYKTENSNETILVPETQVEALRMELATAGYPKSSPNYDLFNDSMDIWTTDYEKTKITLYQLEQRLKQTIETMKPVNTAVIFINAPEDDGYVLGKNKSEPTASVQLDLDKDLAPSQVNGIKLLVAQSGIPGLKVENVAVIDSNGNELAAEKEVSQVSLTEFKTQIEKEFQQNIEGKVKLLLGSIYGGKDHVEVVANVNMDVDKKIQEVITYIPSEQGDNRGVISKEDSKNQMQVDPEGTGGIPGTDTNAQVPTYPNVTVEGNIINIDDQRSYEYLVSQVTEQIEKEAAELKSVTVAITIDQQSMDDEEKDEVINLVSKATNSPLENIAVMNHLFTPASDPTDVPPVGTRPLIPRNILFALIIGAASLLIITILLVVVLTKRSSKKKKLMQKQMEELQAQATIQANFDDLPPLGSVENKSKGRALQDEIKRFSSDNPEIVAQLIRSWLRDEEANV